MMLDTFGTESVPPLPGLIVLFYDRYRGLTAPG
jgi:hypothetical protein